MDRKTGEKRQRASIRQATISSQALASVTTRAFAAWHSGAPCKVRNASGTGAPEGKQRTSREPARLPGHKSLGRAGLPVAEPPTYLSKRHDTERRAIAGTAPSATVVLRFASPGVSRCPGSQSR
ncbi:hypothetical protein LX32DRAFT_689201 [Colletotrichum zoysiae]|uniref:Uncharacterized protein n=1 Tax=Colletotrichum zoysiae TaxID=1216348 RepID=A0AAD9HUT0_9PEZI|nr:hypothetical protein LX32DRAFT_689201 [Colletotrichum zoysiae]